MNSNRATAPSLPWLRKIILTGILLGACAVSGRAQTGFELIKSFGLPALSIGAQPYNQVIVGTDGMLYGTTIFGGTNNLGAVYRMNTNGSGYQLLHSFGGISDGKYPESELLQASDGILYGTTYHGGTNDDGTIFKIGTDGTGYNVLHNLSTDDGRWPFSGLIEGREDGILYGTAQTGGGAYDFGPGTVFKLNKDGSGFTVLCVFTSDTGAGPMASLCEASDGQLYGTTFADGKTNNGTNYNGTVFRESRSGGVPQRVYGFLRNNQDPIWVTGRLVQGTDGMLYGFSRQGGSVNQGTMFRLTTSGSFFQEVFQFPTNLASGYQPNGAPLLAQDGRVYGATSLGGANSDGTLFALNKDGTGFTVLHHLTPSEGRYSQAGFAQSADGTLFGTAANGGTSDNGTVFRVNTNGTSLAVIHNFVAANGGDATRPEAALLISSNTVYGTASSGAAANRGAVFQFSLSGSNYSLLHEFTNGPADGSPTAGVIKATNGNLYGTLPYAGSGNGGLVFKLTTNGTYSVLHEFGTNVNDGTSPQAELLQGNDGMLYGTTKGGGSNFAGTVFKIGTTGDNYTVLWQFTGGADGGYPDCALIQAPDNFLFGTASGGGTNGNGTVYRLDTNGTSLKTLYTFKNPPQDATQPSAGLLLGRDGLLYGTARSGGTNFAGAVFKLNLNGTGETVIYAFNGSTDGERPQAPLVQTASGKLYGTTPSGGTNGDGVTFSLNTNGTGYTNLRQFSGPDGNSPEGALAIASDGSLYGVTQSGAANNFGGIFRLLNAVTITSLQYHPHNVRLTFTGGADSQSYSIVTASNLTGSAWLPIGTAMSDTNGEFQFNDTDPANHTLRFYRSLGP